MFADEEQAAEKYYQTIMTEDDVLGLRQLFSRLDRVPLPARDYLQARCRDVRELGEFFRDRDHLFFVDNERVALTSDDLEAAPQNAADYFEGKLRECRKPVEVMELKESLDDAPENVGAYIRSFYPGKEFKKFLIGRPGVFAVEKNTVYLIELKSVDFFKRRLELFGGGSVPFNRFRGHVGQAPPEIQTYMNTYFHGDHFQDFLIRNSDVFRLHNLHVSLA